MTEKPKEEAVRSATQVAAPFKERPLTDFERLLQQPSKGIDFVPFGSQDAIKLTVSIVQRLIALPSKRQKAIAREAGKSMPETCTERDALRFIAMCQAKRMNPFEGDCFLIGYDEDAGPTYSMVTAHQTYLKRAEINPEYDGMTSGVILLNEDGTTSEREGDFHLPDEKVVGGWARVFFKNRKVPTYRPVRMARFNRGWGVWKDDAAGMIVKCAEADALRSSFPTMLGGLYLREEVDMFPVTPEDKGATRPIFGNGEKGQKLLDSQSCENVPEPPKMPQDDLEGSTIAPTTPKTPPARSKAPEKGIVEDSKVEKNYPKAIRGLLKLASIGEAQLMEWARSRSEEHPGRLEESIGNLDEAQEVAPSFLRYCYDHWREVKPDVQAWITQV
jgi:phage recombination protein Bet